MEISTPKIIGGLGLLSGLLLVLLSGKTKGGNSQTGGGYLDGPDNEEPINAKAKAEDLFLFMNKIGTDEEQILETLTNVSEKQFKSIALAFGKRKYNPYTGNDSGFFLSEYSLKYWLKSELSETDYRQLKGNFPNSL